LPGIPETANKKGMKIIYICQLLFFMESQTTSIGITETQMASFEKAVDFIRIIGIPVSFDTFTSDAFLPGLYMMNGTLIIDRQRLLYPGDILHEAGHIAVVPPSERQFLNADSISKRAQRDAEEMMAIAWSYAACLHLDIDTKFVFHDNGYKDGGSNIAENFKEGRYFGVPVLKWVGMCNNPEEQNGYPKMLRWLRE
jgi:hypothetical protein